MRLVRIGALVGSVVLLVATTVSAVNQRAELRGRLDARVLAAALIVDQAVVASIDRALALADAASDSTDPSRIARPFGDPAEACVVGDGEKRCTGPDLLALGAFGAAAAASVASGGAATAAVDDATDSVLVVARSEVTAVIQVPADALVGDFALGAIEQYDVQVAVELDGTASAGGRRGPERIDGDLVLTERIGLGGDEAGAVVVTVAATDDVGLTGDNLTLYLSLLALGTVLMALAGWTFLLDRRSLERRATTDELTGLVNRREFERLSEESLLAADRFSTGVCVMLIDLNGFKQINDTLGHHVGDQVLQAAAHRLRDAVRDTDTVGRWGGDEFVILLPGLQDGTAVRSSAERVGRRLSDTPIVDEVRVTAAIGAALFPRHGVTLDELIRAADVAMYEAKTSGVTHRLADLSGAMYLDQVLADDYRGPDRRRASLPDS